MSEIKRKYAVDNMKAGDGDGPNEDMAIGMMDPQ